MRNLQSTSQFTGAPQPASGADHMQAERASILEPAPDGVAMRLASNHPARTVLSVFAASIVLIGLLFIGLGLLVVHVLAHGPIGSWDAYVNGWLARHRDPSLNTATWDLTAFADSRSVVILGALATAVGLLLRWGRKVLLLLFALTIELSDFLVANYAVERPRPNVHMGVTPSTFSWPSGHTAATVAFYGGIAVLVMAATNNRAARAVAWSLAMTFTFAVAFARVYRGDHHPTDVIAGMVLGALSLGASVLIFRTWNAAIELRRASVVAVHRPKLHVAQRIAGGQ